jgi:hypothetical protein
MAIGEKLWEGKAKAATTIIKGVDGVWIMATWMADMKGRGKAKGVDGKITFSSKSRWVQTVQESGMGQGILATVTGDMAVVKGYGYGKPVMDKAKSVGI